MSSKALGVRALFDYSGFDVGRDIQTGMMPKFRLSSMPEKHFFLTARFEVAIPVSHGNSGVVEAVLIADLAYADEVVSGAELLVFGLPYRQIGRAVVQEVAEK